ncbi:MAG: 30S ribosomal protein S12 methylthiotransferase RimO, partial [Lachnospiraceae bacterium]|nr:30S ribosomal protein S12 methylthiotransferase RimO [Candidatus Equihabitans merdae]
SEHTIGDAVRQALEGQKTKYIEDLSADPDWKKDTRLSDGRAFAYLKIAEGCDKNCTYCVIPSVRGHYRSYPMEALVEEAAHLVENGARELILVAQETTLYGMDLYGKKSLHILLEKLCAIEDLKWIRILYAYPEEIYDELIEVMAREEKICHYLDMPVQHSSNDVLRRMNRRTKRESILKTIEKLRQAMPDIVLRTTLLTGFPGETEADVDDLEAFIEEAAFDHLGVFAYSQEEDTPAANMPNQIEESEKEARRDRLMEAQQAVSAACGQNRIGQTMEVMIEGYLPDDGIYIARSYGDAPDVDGYVFIESDHDWMTGDFINVEITDASEYDLQGEYVDEYTE